jgi:hypothetical protein
MASNQCPWVIVELTSPPLSLLLIGLLLWLLIIPRGFVRLGVLTAFLRLIGRNFKL